MTNYIEYRDTAAFHPGYYIKEIVEESGISQEEFAKRLDTTPKTLSVLINGGQRLTADLALKLSRMLGTSAQYWLNLQSIFDAAQAEAEYDGELQREKEVLKVLGYEYFRDNFGLPALSRKLDKQVEQVRRFLGVSSLTVLNRPDLATSFRSEIIAKNDKTVIRANAMVQIASNEMREVEAPKFDRERFKRSVEFALTQTGNHDGFLDLLRTEFLEAGVVFVMSADTFWFTLFHEIGHILAGDFGVSIDGDEGASEDAADEYARDALIDRDAYAEFVSKNRFSREAIVRFAQSIGRDAGIVLGRLQNDGHVRYNDVSLAPLRTRYRVGVS